TVFFILLPRPPRPPLFPYTTLFRSVHVHRHVRQPTGTLELVQEVDDRLRPADGERRDDELAVALGRPADDLAEPFGRLVHCLVRSEEHTSELQSRFDLVCRLLLEKK